jgi:tetratricopeptide (TPR) repeat protein
VGIIFGTYISTGFVSPQQLASQYEKDNLQNLEVTMGGQMDSIQRGRDLYNDGKPTEALLYFEKIIHSDSSNSTAKKYAGLSALKLKEYDKALAWFKELETYSQDFANPGLLYEHHLWIVINPAIKQRQLSGYRSLIMTSMEKKPHRNG